MENITSKEVRLSAIPQGMPTLKDFRLTESKIEMPKNGELLVKNIWMSVDPYMRGRMRGAATHMGGFKVGKTLEGGALGVVETSNHPEFAVGDYVSSMKGWRQFFVSDGRGLIKISDPIVSPISTYLGALGMPGLTAYVGLARVAKINAGENVFVSAASGAVGSIACQIAKAMGCYVVGSAGSDEKCKWLIKEAGVDKAINYKSCGNLNEAVKDAFPNGADVYFDNVGGAHLDAALNALNLFGRAAMCGMISQYNISDESPYAPRNLMMIVWKQLKLQGFIVRSHIDLEPVFHAAMRRWIKEGRVVWKETIEEGIENASRAFINLFTGENFGKMLVRL